MIDRAIGIVPVLRRAEAVTYVLIAAAFMLGWAANYERRATVITQTRMTHKSVSQILGKPVQTVDGAQINPALAGLSCGVYATGQTITKLYCHR